MQTLLRPKVVAELFFGVKSREGGNPQLVSESVFLQVREEAPTFLLSPFDCQVARALFGTTGYVSMTTDDALLPLVVRGGLNAISSRQCENILFTPSLWEKLGALVLEAFRDSQPLHESWRQALLEVIRSV